MPAGRDLSRMIRGMVDDAVRQGAEVAAAAQKAVADKAGDDVRRPDGALLGRTVMNVKYGKDAAIPGVWRYVAKDGFQTPLPKEWSVGTVVGVESGGVWILLDGKTPTSLVENSADILVEGPDGEVVASHSKAVAWVAQNVDRTAHGGRGGRPANASPPPVRPPREGQRAIEAALAAIDVWTHAGCRSGDEG